MIKLDKISVEFKGKADNFEAVKDVSLVIEKSEIFGIVGTSGAGKSTLLRTINLLQRPTKGEIWIDNKNITNYTGEELRQIRLKTGMIFQSFNLIKGKTVSQNIAFALKARGVEKEIRDSRVRELLDLVGLPDKGNAYPSQLSGGQKQRVGIARALSNNPDILLCDEATSALDLESTEAIVSLLKEINKKLGITIIFISHELEVIKSLCHRVGVMSQGNLVEVGAVFDIFASPQDDFTKQLVSKTINLSIPEEVKAMTQGKLIRLQYKGDQTLEPVISSAAKHFKVDLNILHGNIQYINGKPLGALVIGVQGIEEEVNKAISYINGKVQELEVIYDGRNSGAFGELRESAV
jgi:D-methionine transport system ATP-binding protein